MKERPILFSAPMVRALLDGSKTQTRRVLREPPPEDTPHYVCTVGTYSGVAEPRHYWGSHESFEAAYEADDDMELWPDAEQAGIYGPGGLESPFGSEKNCIKDAARLWVREAWRALDVHDHIPPREMNAGYRLWYEADAPHQPGAGKYRPGMFMPRWASRITLEIASIRVERLQDISEADAIAEGVERWVIGEGWRDYRLDAAQALAGSPPMLTAKDSYRTLWESINGPGSWDANPRVWVVEFRVMS